MYITGDPFGTLHPVFTENLSYSHKGDSSGFIRIFSSAISPLDNILHRIPDLLSILTRDDFTINTAGEYDYYEYDGSNKIEKYNAYYENRINEIHDEMADINIDTPTPNRKNNTRNRQIN